MKNNRLLPMSLIAIAVLAGCSSLPASNSLLDQTRNDYNNAQASPQVANLAASELKQASESLDKANTAWSKGEKTALVDHLAYVAKQQVAIAQETARQKAAELAVANANVERDKVLLDARTREAELAQRSAEASQRQVVMEKQATSVAQMDAQAARQQTQDAEIRSRKLEAQLKEIEAKKTDRGMVITLGDVLFDTNHAQLKSGGMRNIQKLADFLKQYPQRKALIEGFTDSTGSDSRNQELSDQRANAVRTALLDLGIATDRITSRGYGASYPVADNKTATGRQMNRRVEIIVSDESGNIGPR